MSALNEDAIEQNLIELLISQGYHYFHGSSLAPIVIKEENGVLPESQVMADIL